MDGRGYRVHRPAVIFTQHAAALAYGECRSLDSLRSLGMTEEAALARDD